MVEGNNYLRTGAATETASMVLTCVVDCHRRGGRDKVSFFRIPTATDPKGKNQTKELLCKRRQAWNQSHQQKELGSLQEQ